MIELNDDNFLIFAIKNYDNPSTFGMSDLEEDLKRFKYIKRLFRRYTLSGNISERLVLNHLIVLYNVFGEAATLMLLYKLNKDYWGYLKTFLIFLNRMTPEDLPEVSVDLHLTQILRVK